MERLQAYQCNVEMECDSTTLGHTASRGCRKHQARENRIKRLKESFTHPGSRLSVHHYLCAIASNLYESDIKKPATTPRGFPIVEDAIIRQQMLDAYPPLNSESLAPAQGPRNTPSQQDGVVPQGSSSLSPDPASTQAASQVLTSQASTVVAPSLAASTSQGTTESQVTATSTSNVPSALHGASSSVDLPRVDAELSKCSPKCIRYVILDVALMSTFW